MLRDFRRTGDILPLSLLLVRTAESSMPVEELAMLSRCRKGSGESIYEVVEHACEHWDVGGAVSHSHLALRAILSGLCIVTCPSSDLQYRLCVRFI